MIFKYIFYYYVISLHVVILQLFNSPDGDQRCTYVDINGDGFNDIAIAIPSANSRDGMIIVVFGHSMTTPFPDIDLSTNLALAGVGFKVK